MNCDVIRDLLPLAADGLLSPTTQQLVEDHLCTCDSCRLLLEQMRAPMEAIPIPREEDYQKALQSQQRRTHRRLLLSCVATALVVLTVLWLSMEYRFQGYRVEMTPIRAEEALTQFPQLPPSSAELTAAEQVFSQPTVQQAQSKKNLQDLPADQAESLFSSLLPLDAQMTEAFAGQHIVGLGYYTDQYQVILEFLDGDLDGTCDMLRKTMWRRNETDQAYVLEYYPVVETAYYQRTDSQRQWFAFLRQP